MTDSLKDVADVLILLTLVLVFLVGTEPILWLAIFWMVALVLKTSELVVKP